MSIQARILQALDQSDNGTLLRTEARRFGKREQVSKALNLLHARGDIKQIASGVYSKPASTSIKRKRKLIRYSWSRDGQDETARTHRPKDMTAKIAQVLAKQSNVVYSATYADHWANVITRLAGDDPTSDATDDRLVALTRAGKLSPGELVQMVISHHRGSRAV